MRAKKAGVALLGLSAGLGGLFIYYLSKVQTNQMALGCAPATPDCLAIQSQLSVTHFIVGLLSAVFSLGLYMLLFSREDKMLEQWKEDKTAQNENERFQLLLRGLDPLEQKIMHAVHAEPGVEQNTLRLKTDLSKAKISQVLTTFERRGLVKREARGKTYAVYGTVG